MKYISEIAVKFFIKTECKNGRQDKGSSRSCRNLTHHIHQSDPNLQSRSCTVYMLYFTQTIMEIIVYYFDDII